MDKKKKPDIISSTDLRQKAEEELSKLPPAVENISQAENSRLFHELRVYQIELEMQNVQLRQSMEELEAERLRYFAWYDQSPVGYCTISEKGQILEANLTAANLIGIPRSALIKQFIIHFILEKDQDIYYQYLKQLFEKSTLHTGELHMVKQNGEIFYARLEGTSTKDMNDVTVGRVLVSDITEHYKSEIQIKEQIEELRRWYSATLGRENRILELKAEVNKLLAEVGRPPRYVNDSETSLE